MRRLVLFGIVAATLLCGQYRELLRSEAITLTGIVVDPDGKPIPGVRIDHHGNLTQTILTSADGTFELQTKAPALVLRKEGYRSYFVRTSATMQAKIVLDRDQSAGTPRLCPPNPHCGSIEGWGARFCFPRISGVQLSPQGHDIDYGIRNYIVKAENGPVAIMHGSGPTWSFGTPVDPDVWKSIQYNEVTYVIDKLVILDARGRTSNGTRWRYLGKFGESASYSGADEDAARLLDRVLDGMCIRR